MIDCEKIVKRYEKILKQADKQQLETLKLKEKVETLFAENKAQLYDAKRKLERLIINEYKNSKIVFKPQHILSGDFYSIIKLNKGYLVYVIDGQGHGVTPALTIFGIASTIKTLIKKFSTFDDFIQHLFENIKQFLDELEQISFTFLYIDTNFSFIEYTIGGMYPFYIKTKNDIKKFKANSLPFMMFFDIPNIEKCKIDIEKLIIYSDGLVEENEDFKDTFHPIKLLEEDGLFDKLNDLNTSLEDDLTVVLVNK